MLRNQPTHIYKFVAETLEDELDQRALQEMKQIEAAQKAKGEFNYFLYASISGSYWYVARVVNKSQRRHFDSY